MVMFVVTMNALVVNAKPILPIETFGTWFG